MFNAPLAYGMPKKTCNGCSEEKFLYEFTPSKPKCKECQAKIQRDYRRQMGGETGKKWNRFAVGNNLPAEVRSLCFSNEGSK